MHPIIEQAAKLPQGKLSQADLALVERIASVYPSAFVTGTGLWSPESANDFDICVSCSKHWAIDALDLRNCNDVGSFGSIRPEGSAINIVCLSEKYYDKWLAATRMMSAIKPISDQQVRHGVFEALCGAAAVAQLRALPPVCQQIVDEAVGIFRDSVRDNSLTRRLMPPVATSTSQAIDTVSALARLETEYLLKAKHSEDALVAMSVQQALWTVLTMAKREYETSSPLLSGVYGQEFYRDALNIVEDFIVNRFGED